MGHYVPHTDAETAQMLAFMGLSTIEELFASVPPALRLAAGELPLAPGLSEFDALAAMDSLGGANRRCGPDLVCFAGAGAYDHEIPAAVRSLAFRSEFVTAYTPYQPEVSQGVLQALFEYQTMVARLAGVEVANASLYDGASATAEAINLATAVTGRDDIWLSDGVHPTWRQVVRTLAAGSGHRLHSVPLRGGQSAWPGTGSGSGPAAPAAPAALVVQYPNYLGCLEDLAEAAGIARELGALLVVAFDHVAAGILRSPGSFGADVVVGEGQPFGTPLSFGGPYLGLFACRMEHVRRLPGRLVGETVDADGRRAYVTTLRTREQDIRRERASSNVCTNQTLIAVCCAVQLAWLGTSGLAELALRCARATRYLREALLRVDGVEPLVPAPTFREFAVRTPVPPPVLIERMADNGFLAGVPLGEAGAMDGGEYGDGILIAATEKRTAGEIDAYVSTFEKAIR